MFADNSRSCGRSFFVNFWEGGLSQNHSILVLIRIKIRIQDFLAEFFHCWMRKIVRILWEVWRKFALRLLLIAIGHCAKYRIIIILMQFVRPYISPFIFHSQTILFMFIFFHCTGPKIDMFGPFVNLTFKRVTCTV